jgi:hypothetical protein
LVWSLIFVKYMLGISVLVSCLSKLHARVQFVISNISNEFIQFLDKWCTKLHTLAQFVISQRIKWVHSISRQVVHQILYELCSDIICVMLACLSMLFFLIIFVNPSMLMPLSQLALFFLQQQQQHSFFFYFLLIFLIEN